MHRHLDPRSESLRGRALALPVTVRSLRSAAGAGLLMVVLSLLLLALGACSPGADGGEVRVRGILTEEITDCQALTSEDGELYALTGDLGSVASGDLVEVTGTLGDEGDCDGGIVVRVASLEVVAGPTSTRSGGETVGEPLEADENGMTGDSSDDFDEDAPIGEAGPNGQLLLEGELTDEGVECQAFRNTEDDELYTLTGDLGGYTTGDRVRIVATPVDVSTCQQGQTVEIVEIGEIESEDDAAQI